MVDHIPDNFSFLFSLFFLLQKSAKLLSLDLGEDHIVLHAHPNLYYLDIYLPFIILPEDSGAQFNRDTKVGIIIDWKCLSDQNGTFQLPNFVAQKKSERKNKFCIFFLLNNSKNIKKTWSMSSLMFFLFFLSIFKIRVRFMGRISLEFLFKR